MGALHPVPCQCCCFQGFASAAPFHPLSWQTLSSSWMSLWFCAGPWGIWSLAFRGAPPDMGQERAELLSASGQVTGRR